MKAFLVSSLFSLSCLAVPMEEFTYLVGREASPQFGASAGTNMAAIMSSMSSMLAGLRVGAAATTTSARPAATSTVPGSSDGSSTYITPILAQHNNHRQNHSTSNLVWNTALANTAAKIAANCYYAHNVTADGGGYGQNIGAGYYPSQVPAMLTNGMYDGEVGYYPPFNGQEPSLANFSRFGHFTQIVWKGTTSVGCYTQYCPNGLGNTGGANVRPYFTVCNYSPPGNYQGQFAANVFPPISPPLANVVIPM